MKPFLPLLKMNKKRKKLIERGAKDFAKRFEGVMKELSES